MKPLEADLPEEALAVLAGAQRLETVFEGSRTVWHRWSHGERDGAPLILLHGGSGSWAHWVRNIQWLVASGRTVFAPDIPGFGDSDPAAGARDVDGVIAPLLHGIREVAGAGPHEIMGFSFGGMTAVLLAAAEPALVRHLVLVAPPGLGLRATRLALRPWLGIDDAQQVEKIHRSNLATLMLHRQESIDATAVAIHSANLLRDRMRGRKLALTDIVARTLGTLQTPFDVVLGEHDALYAQQLAQFESVMRAMPACGQVVIVPGAGHWVQYEDPAGFARAASPLLQA